jgi:hypothetical protein
MSTTDDINHRIPESDIENALAQLAADLGRVPNTTDWREWTDSPCDESHIRERYDGWTGAIDAAGLPVVPRKASEIIRKIAYQRPDLAGGSSEGNDK